MFGDQEYTRGRYKQCSRHPGGGTIERGTGCFPIDIEIGENETVQRYYDRYEQYTQVVNEKVIADDQAGCDREDERVRCPMFARNGQRYPEHHENGSRNRQSLNPEGRQSSP